MPVDATNAAPRAIEKIGGYDVIKKLDTGGVADIYLCRQPSLDRPVAVKVLSANVMSDPDIARRFDREALTIARLNHPNIVHVIDRGVDQDSYFIVMDHVDGRDLKTLAESKKLTVPQKCDLIIQVLKALDYAHKNNVIHRDIKPANILVDNELNAHIADFGIAQLIDPDRSEHAGTSAVMGTPAYMAPEQKTPSGTVGQTADLYAVGVVFHELLTGEKPLGRFRPAASYDASIPPGLDEVLCRAMAERPEDRYQTAVEFKDAILGVLSRARIGDAPPADSPSVREAGQILGRCVLLEAIKEHRYGATYLVEDRDTHELIVIKKIIHRKTGLRAAQLLSRLKHPNIVNIFGSLSDEDEAIVLMEYARGGTLSDRLVRKMPWGQALDLLRPCVEALNFAHKNHVLHGNLRPSNILINKDGIPLLSDFGLPEHYSPESVNWYGAPEEIRNIQSDIYSLGVVFFQLTTNQLPMFDPEGRLQPMNKLADIPERFELILARMLDTSPERRYPSCDELAEDIAHFAQIQKRPVPGFAASRNRRKHYRLGWAGWIVGFLSGLVVAGLLAYTLGILDLWLAGR